MKGLRLYPIYHRYGLLEAESNELLDEASEKRLPIELPVTLVDPRLHHWLDVDAGLSAEQVSEAVNKYAENVMSPQGKLNSSKAFEMSRLSAVLRKFIQTVV